MSLALAAPAGSVFGPIEDEVVVHHRQALQAEALGDELLLGRLVVHEQDVGVAAPAVSSAWPVPQRDDAHVDAASPS